MALDEDKPESPSADNPRQWQRINQWLVGAITDNLTLKFVSLVLALTVFILVNTDKRAVIGAYVGVSYSMPENRVRVSEPVDQVRVSISGSWRTVKHFDERALDRIHIDLRGVASDQEVVSIDKDMIRLPTGLKIQSIEPTTMRIRFEPKATKLVRVSPATTGRVARGWEVERVVAKPSQVLVRGAASFVDAISEIRTRPVSLDGRSESFSERVAVMSPDRAEIVDRAPVEVDVRLVETRDRPLVVDDVPVVIRTEPGDEGLGERFEVQPPRVKVVLHGSLLSLEQIIKSDLIAYVRVSADDLAGGRVKNKTVLVDVPDGVGRELTPQVVSLWRGPGRGNK